MATRTRLEKLAIEEASGVDHPANEQEGWIVMKNAASGGSSSGNTTFYTDTTTSYPNGSIFIQTTGTGTGFTPVEKTEPHAYEEAKDGSGKCAKCGKAKDAPMHKAFVAEKSLMDIHKHLVGKHDQSSHSRASHGKTERAEAAGLLLGGVPGYYAGRYLSTGKLKTQRRTRWNKKKKTTKSMGGRMAEVNLEGLADDIKKHIDGLEAELAEATQRYEEAEAALDHIEEQVQAHEQELAAAGGEQIDKAKLPEPIRKALEEAEARTKAEVEKAAALEERVAKMERDRLEGEYIAKARDAYANIGAAEELGRMLLDVAEKTPAETYQTLERTLKAVNARLEKSALFGVAGHPQGDDTTLEGRIQKMAQEMVDKGEAQTIQIAKAKILSSNEEIRREYAERRGH